MNVLDGFDRTTNKVEGWHSKFKKKIDRITSRQYLAILLEHKKKIELIPTGYLYHG